MLRLGDLENELETSSTQVSDQVKDVRQRYDTVRNNIDTIVDELESAHAEQASYRDMLQVSTYFRCDSLFYVNLEDQIEDSTTYVADISAFLFCRIVKNGFCRHHSN